MKKYFRRLLIWIGIMQMRPQAEVIEQIKKSIKVEEQDACNHKMLSALFPADRWYRCTSCDQVWYIVDADVIKADKIKPLARKLYDIAKKMPNNKRSKSLDDFRKEANAKNNKNNI